MSLKVPLVLMAVALYSCNMNHEKIYRTVRYTNLNKSYRALSMRGKTKGSLTVTCKLMFMHECILTSE